jgi:hypothetical protein
VLLPYHGVGLIWYVGSVGILGLVALGVDADGVDTVGVGTEADGEGALGVGDEGFEQLNQKQLLLLFRLYVAWPVADGLRGVEVGLFVTGLPVG